MATLFDENRFEEEIDSKVKTIVKNEIPTSNSYTAEVIRKDSEGTWWVRFDGNDSETPVLVNKIDMSVGDKITVTVNDHVTVADGNVTSPPMSAYNAQGYIDRVVATNIEAVSADVGFLKADVATIGYAQIEDADITTARIQNLVTQYSALEGSFNVLEANALTASSATITDLQAQTAKVENITAGDLEATVGYIGDLTAGNISAADIASYHADITVLEADNASIKGRLTAAEGDITNLTAADATITGRLTAAEGVIDDLDATYAHIDLANVNNAWIQNGVVKDAAISDAQIIGVSANKLTAGTINAAEIDVTNLHASSLIVDKLNGQPVLGGYTYVNKNITGYASKNPSNEGWYEMTANGFVLSTDTSVDLAKAYYTQGTATRLYDQTYIDGVVDDLNGRIDAQIETFTEDHVPTLNNSPAVDWTTNDDKAGHVGDICYVLNAGSDYDGYTYRFAYDNATGSYKWVLIKDNQVTAALGRISDLETFESTTTSWIEETDEGLETIRTNHTTLSGRVDKVVKSSIQLWYTKADTTAPNPPSSVVTSTSTSGNAWRTVVPTYSSSYPYYFYCWQYQYEDGTYGWSAVIYDRATSESEERARTGVANAATAQATANSNIKSSVQLWFTKANATAPTKPTSQVTTSSASTSNAWNLVVPIYSSSYPYYYYCYQQQKGDNTYQWTDVVYDEATSTAMKKAQEALPASTFTTFEQTTFKDVVDEVDEQSSTITQLTTITENNGLTTSTNIMNTMNSVTQTATGNSTKLSQLTTTLGTNADGTTKTGDIVHRMSATEQDLSGFKTTVSSTYATKQQVDDLGVDDLEDRVSQAESSIIQNADNIALKVSTSDYNGTTVASLINQSADSVKIQANHVEISGSAVFSAINSDTGTTKINGGKIDATSISIGDLSGSIGGRNLALDSLGEYSVTKTADSAFVIGTRKPISDYGQEVCVAGATVLVSFDAKVSSGTHPVCPYLADSSSVTANEAVDNCYATTQWQRFTRALTLNANAVKWNVTANTSTGSNGVTYYTRNVKVETGNKATDWTPAPEDVDASISDAAKTATNYIEADSGGIKIFDSSASKTAGSYQHQTSTATEFFTNGDSVAKFGSETRIGDENSYHFLVEGQSLAAYDSNGELYFSVSKNGLLYGNSTAASADSVASLISNVGDQVADLQTQIDDANEVLGGVEELIDGKVEEVNSNLEEASSHFDEEISKLGESIDTLGGYISINDGVLTLGSASHPVVAKLSDTGLVFSKVDNGEASSTIASLEVDFGYQLTEDTSITSGKTYYTYNAALNDYVAVSSPTAANLSTYYERTIPEGEGKLIVHRAVVVNELQFGDWKWTPRANGNLALKWIGA